jgi:hypothetical protein
MKSVLSRWNPFRLRNLVGTALVLGILAGIWLGDLLKGLGLGSGDGKTWLGGTLQEGRDEESPRNSSDRERIRTQQESAAAASSEFPSGGIVKVLIDDRSYFIRDGDQNRPISLEALVRLIEQTAPNEDGLRAMIDRTPSSRASAEIRLSDALKEAGIPENSIYLSPHAVE